VDYYLAADQLTLCPSAGRYAPNVLVYPFGDWYGTLQPEEVESFMDSLLGVEGEDSLSGPQSPLWRGSWFDHPGVPKEVNHDEETGREENVFRIASTMETEGLGVQRLRNRLELELARAERDGLADGRGAKGELGADVEESWGMDLDKLARGD
jgi:(2Fe-2S) ferredoxin